jgi:hypothetical protein
MINVEKEIILKGLSEIKPYEKNPRKNDKTVELLCKIIPRVGFNVPIVIDADGIIVKGHARYQAATRLGMTQVPCIVTHADPEAIKADRIADNKISEFSEWISEELAHEVDMLDLEFDLADMGLPRETFDDIPDMEDFGFDGGDDVPQMSDEDKQKLYAEFLERQTKENAVEVQMTTEAAIKAAVYKQAHTPKPAREYGKCVCKKCGNIMYVDKNVLYDRNGVIRRK